MFSGSGFRPARFRLRLETALVATGATLALASQLQRPGPEMDEGIVLAYADRVLHGAVPYRDFQEFYGPGNTWAVAAAFELFGASQGVERAVGLGYAVVTVVAVYAIVRRLSRAAAIVSAIITLAIGLDGGVWAYTTRGAVAFLLASIALATGGGADRRALRLGASGALAGVVLLFRYDFVLPVALASIAVLRPMTKRCRISYLASLGAFVLLYLPYLVLTGTGGISRTVREAVSVPAGRRLPLPTPAGSFAGLLLLGSAIALALLLVSAVILLRDRSAEATAPLAVGLTAIGAIPFVVQRADSIHIESVAIAVYGLLPLAWIVIARRGRESPAIRIACALTAMLAVVLGVVPLVVDLVKTDVRYASGRDLYPRSVHVTSHGRTFIFSNPVAARSAESVLTAVDRRARKGERLFVGPYDLRFAFYGPSYLYFMLPQLRPASYFMQFAPWTANRPGSGLARDVASADWVILVSTWDRIREPNDSSKVGSALPNEVVRRRFCLVLEEGSYRLFHHRSHGRCPATA